MSSQEFRHIVRILGADSAGTLKTSHAVSNVRGISLSMANAILRKAAINPNIRAGFLTDSDIAKVEDIIRDPARYNLPSWLFNRRKDTETGNDLHMISADLAFKTKTDIDDAKSIRCWRG